MHVLSEPLFWIAILIAAVVVGGVYWFDRRKKSIIRADKLKDNSQDKQDTSDQDDKYEKGMLKYYDEHTPTIPVRLCDNLLGQIYDTAISDETALAIIKEHGSLGRRWDRYGKKIYGIVRSRGKDEVIKLQPITVQSEISNSPTELFNDLTQPEIKLVISELVKADEKGAWGDVVKYLPWLVALGFLAFLWAFS